MGTLTKHGVKQVDRLLSNRGVDVGTFFAYWTPYIVGARKEVIVALDWTSFAADGQDTIVLSMLTGHGRATPLLWKTVASSTLKGNQRRYEYEVLCRLREVLPAGVKITVVADRGFADCKLFYALTEELTFEYVIRLRGDIYVTNARGERRPAAAWVGAGGRARRLVGARVTDAHELPVGVVVCVHDRKMDEPWCLAASEAIVPTPVLIRYYGKRWGIEAGFRDIKDMRFGMGLSSMHVSRPDRRDRLLLISALAIAMLSLLGAAGERIGYDRWLKANTVKRRTHSLFRQGLMLYHHLPNWPDDRIRPLTARGRSLFAEPTCSGSLAMSDCADQPRWRPLEVPRGRQTPPERGQGPDQSANGRKSPPLQAPGRADAGQAAQQLSEVATGRLDEHPLAHILVAAHPHPPQPPGLVLVRERPLHQLPAAALKTTTSVAANTPTVPI